MHMNWNSSALLIIDMQNDFAKTSGSAYIEGTAGVTKNLAGMANYFRARKRPVIHIIRLYLEDGSNAELCRKSVIREGTKMVVPGTDGARIVSELLPTDARAYADEDLLAGKIISIGEQDFVVYKPRWGAFYRTELDAWLRNAGIDSLVIAGCNFPNCPRTTLFEASERDYQLAIVPETISKIYTKGVEELQAIGVNVLDMDGLKSALDKIG